MKAMIHAPTAFASLALGLFITPVGAQVLFHDADFGVNNWSATKIHDDSASTSIDVVASQQSSGGNPGAFRASTLSFSESGNVTHGNISLASVFVPSTLGPVGSITWRADLRGDPNLDNATFGYSLLLLQGGVYYTYWGHTASGGAWQTVGDSSLVADDFFRADNPNSSSHPDFSSSAANISLGYVLSKQDSGSGGITTGIDNWSVTISPVPEPASSALLAGAGLVGLATMRRYLRRGERC